MPTKPKRLYSYYSSVDEDRFYTSSKTLSTGMTLYNNTGTDTNQKVGDVSDGSFDLYLYTYTIDPTPVDATVALTHTKYTQSGNSISVPYNATVNWNVSRTDYKTQSGTKIVTSTSTDSIVLTQALYAWSLPYSSSNITTVYTKTENPVAGTQLYDANGNVLSITTPSVTGVGSSTSFNWVDANLGRKQWQAIAKGAGKYVTIGMSGYVSTSTDGTHWTTATALPSGVIGTFYALAYGNGRFVALSYNQSATAAKAIYSTDGVNWTLSSGFPPATGSKISNCWQRLTFDGTKFVGVTTSGFITTSTDGETWSTPVDKLSNHSWFCLHYLGGKLIAIGSKSKDTSAWVATSTDANTWTVTELANKGSTIYQWCTYHDNRYYVYDGHGICLISDVDSTTSWSGPTSTDLGDFHWRYGLDERDTTGKFFYIAYYGNGGFSTTSATPYIELSQDGSATLQHIRDSANDID